MEGSFYEKAKENLEAAKGLYKMELYNASANRAYYSAFHAALTYLFHNGFNPTLSHRNVLSMFVNEYINKKKIFPLKFKSIFYNLQNIRNIADYGITVSKNEANKQLKNADLFVTKILTELKNENKS